MNLNGLKGWFARNKDVVFLAIFGSVVPLGYALYTQHIWEDFFITFRHSQNLCEGHGLVYNVGERVHGFTSPLGVLLPAFFYSITGQTSYLPALWLFRILSIVAFVVGGALVLRSLKTEGNNRRLIQYAFIGLYVLEAKAVAFSMNGMETAFMLLFLGWALYLLDSTHPRAWLARGVAWAGLLWTRPDGCVYIAALVLANLVFTRQSRKPLLRSFCQSGGLTLLLYLPWVLWAWSYYGSPIPNTVLAKGAIDSAQLDLSQLLPRLGTHFLQRTAQVFSPIFYPIIWSQPAWIGQFSQGLGLFCALYWLVPVRDPVGRTASLCYALLCLYLAFLAVVAPWYCPPVALCGLVVLALGVFTLSEVLMRSLRGSRAVSIPVLLGVCAEMACVLAITARQMKLQEKEVEMGNRAAIGRWLKTQVQEHETVFLEPVGYIGYFSNAHIVDYPGLVSPQTVQLLKTHRATFFSLIAELKPTWTVLRPWEVTAMLNTNPYFRDHYDLVNVFDVAHRVKQYQTVPGWEYLMSDATFYIFKKRSSQPKPQGSAGARAVR
jgi:hypothetical protein